MGNTETKGLAFGYRVIQVYPNSPAHKVTPQFNHNLPGRLNRVP